MNVLWGKSMIYNKVCNQLSGDALCSSQRFPDEDNLQERGVYAFLFERKRERDRDIIWENTIHISKKS